MRPGARVLFLGSVGDRCHGGQRARSETNPCRNPCLSNREPFAMPPCRLRRNHHMFCLLAMSALATTVVAWARSSLRPPRLYRGRRLVRRISLTASVPPEACQVSIKILHESDRILVIDKPHGISHHSSRPIAEGDDVEGDTTILGILALLREQQAIGRLNYQGRLYGVHRLDQVTSGILVLAKDQEMSRDLTRAFRTGNVIKYYTGISMVKAKKKQGWVKGRMVRGRRKSWYLTREKDDGSNYAVTRYFTSGLGSINRFEATNPEIEAPKDAGASPKTLILFRPHTGRTHQLRVAAKSVGIPIAGDPLYSDNLQHALDRTYLHATALRIPDMNLAVVSLPPFGPLWSLSGSDVFVQSLRSLVEKHCDDEILRDLLKQQLSEITTA